MDIFGDIWLQNFDASRHFFSDIWAQKRDRTITAYPYLWAVGRLPLLLVRRAWERQGWPGAKPKPPLPPELPLLALWEREEGLEQ